MERRASSTQSMTFPLGYSEEEVTRLYFHWLSSLFRGLIRTPMADDLALVEIKLFSLVLLHLKREESLCGVNFLVTGGALARGGGRFSFRGEGEKLITSLDGFYPRLPWPLYRITQYPIHEGVMYLFSQHLKTLKG